MLLLTATILAFALPVSVAAETPAGPLPEDLFPELEEILQDSRALSWRMLEEELAVEGAEAEAEVRAAGRYPSLTGRFRYAGRLEERADFDRTRRFFQPQAGVTARQPLYHWGAIRANSRIGELRTEMARAEREEVYRLLVLDVRERFLELAVRSAEIALAERRRDLAEREFSAAERRFEREEITGEERKRFELAASDATLRVERLERERNTAIGAVSRLAGFDRQETGWVPEEIPAVSITEAEERGGPAMSRYRPGKEESRLRIREAEEEIAIERARQRPQLDLVAGVMQDQVAVFDRSDIDRTVVFGGIEVTWNIFDGFETRGRQAGARARKRLAEARRERAEREWEAGIERLEDALDWSARDLALSEERLDLAEGTLARRREELERGQISETEMARARVEFAERKLAVTRTRAEYLMATAEVLSETGVDPIMRRYYQEWR